MVVCRYFMQGTCKFGNNCKYEHTYNTNAGDGTSIMRARNTSTSVDLATLVKSVQTDMVNSERGGQWLLSSYAPFKEKPIFPGFEEKLFEEVRYEFYEATMAGTVEQYKVQLQEMLLSAAQRVRALQAPNDQIAQTLYQIYNTPTRQTAPGFTQSQPPFGGTQSFVSQPSANIFASAASTFTSPMTTTNSPFASVGATNSPFVSQPQPQSAPAFGQQMQSSGNIFGGSGGGGGGGSIFAQAARNFQPQPQSHPQQQPQAQPPPQYMPQSIFGGGAMAPPSTQSIFGVTQSTTTMASQAASIFGGVPSSTTTLASQGGSIFGGSQPQPSNTAMVSQTPSIFGGTQPSTTSMVSQSASIFGGQGGGMPQTSTASLAQAPSIFGGSAPTGSNTTFSSSTSSIFGVQPTATTASTNIFGQAAQKMPIFAPPATNIFAQGGQGQAGAPFAAAPVSKTNIDCYSPTGQLPPEVVNLFMADSFQFGRVPIMPPTVDLCR